MKKILFGLIGFLNVINSSGQELDVRVEIDSAIIIRTEKIPTKEICFGIPYGKVFISKESLIEAWDNELAVWGNELDKNPQNKYWQIENYKKSMLYLDFVKKQEKIFFEYLSDDYDSVSQIEEQRPETDTLYYIENQLKEIVCTLLDMGEFEVLVDNKRIEKVIKAKVRRTTDYYETISTEYIVNDSIYFWICPPIIHADFVVDPENMIVPEPPKD